MLRNNRAYSTQDPYLGPNHLSAFRAYFRISRLTAPAVIAACLLLASPASADTAAFDLVGPKVEVRVERQGKTLPIAEVPSLQAGDRLWVHPDLPDIHVSLLSRKNTGAQARSGARVFRMQNRSARILPLGGGSCLRRTRHPFTVSGPKAVTED